MKKPNSSGLSVPQTPAAPKSAQGPSAPLTGPGGLVSAGGYAKPKPGAYKRRGS